MTHKQAALLLPLYQQAINKIDDLFEYRCNSMTNGQLKKEVCNILLNLTENIARTLNPSGLIDPDTGDFLPHEGG